MTRVVALAALCVLGLRVGSMGGAQADEPKPGEAAPPAKPGDVGIPANLQTTDGVALKKAIEAQHGKVVFVNLWATWCVPCVQEFPELVKLYNNYQQKGFVLIGASIDEPEDRAKVGSFMTEQKALFPIFVRQAGTVDQFLDPLDRKWEGIVPTTYIFDRKGKRAGKPVIGVRSYAQYESRLKPLLK